jgi:hypothetical protein
VAPLRIWANNEKSQGVSLFSQSRDLIVESRQSAFPADV